MGVESWLAMKDSLTHQSWLSRLNDVCFVTIFTFPYFLNSLLNYLRYGWGGEGAERFLVRGHCDVFDSVNIARWYSI